MNGPETIFRYACGERVCELDEINSHGHRARVTRVFQPLTDEARDYDCFETGGIFIEEEWDKGINPILMTPPDCESWEDIQFVRRGGPR